MTRILVVEDDVALGSTLAEILTIAGNEVEVLTSGQEALDLLAQSTWDVVVTDLILKDTDGFAVLQAARRHHPPLQVIMITGYGSKDVAVKALKGGAAFYLEKPIDYDEFTTKVSKAAAGRHKDMEAQELRHQVDKNYSLEGLIGKSRGMQRLFDTLWQIAPTAATVLILGESGTGKELVARALHNLSPRRQEPIVAINCGGLNEGVMESELFGHVKGAFTGAHTDRKGKLEFAHGGTLFLDEIGEMPLSTQVKFLRVLEDQQVIRLGANNSRTVDVRIVAATNADLEEKVRSGEFRQDLYFRIKVVEVVLPPLRERGDDIRLLAEHFIGHFSQIHGREITGIDGDALHQLMSYSWPGNVRELRNSIETMVVMVRGTRLTTQELPPSIRTAQPSQIDPFHALAGMKLATVEKELIRVTLEQVENNRAKAAVLLGIGERTLYRKIREYGL